MGNIDKMGLCRGSYWDGNTHRKERCLRHAENKHMTPKGIEYFLCDDCESLVMEALDAREFHLVNRFIEGGRRTTGL
jgi:hypothetical protein